MFSIKKQTYYRSKSHLKNVASLECQLCGVDCQTQAAHSNWTKFGGKGRGLKASDEFTAALCYRCHAEIDSGSKLSKYDRISLWITAFEKTVKKLTDMGLWPVDVPVPDLRKSD